LLGLRRPDLRHSRAHVPAAADEAPYPCLRSSAGRCGAAKCVRSSSNHGQYDNQDRARDFIERRELDAAPRPSHAARRRSLYRLQSTGRRVVGEGLESSRRGCSSARHGSTPRGEDGSDPRGQARPSWRSGARRSAVRFPQADHASTIPRFMRALPAAMGRCVDAVRISSSGLPGVKPLGQKL